MIIKALELESGLQSGKSIDTPIGKYWAAYIKWNLSCNEKWSYNLGENNENFCYIGSNEYWHNAPKDSSIWFIKFFNFRIECRKRRKRRYYN